MDNYKLGKALGIIEGISWIIEDKKSADALQEAVGMIKAAVEVNNDGPANKLCARQKHPLIDPADDCFGAVLNCAVRYAMGRRTYMPGLVIDFVTPLIPRLSSKTLLCFDQDITEQRWTGGYGDPAIDEPEWMRFHEAVRKERQRRGDTLYKSWRDDDVT